VIPGCLEELPGSAEFHAFAAQIGADLLPDARQVATERTAQALIDPPPGRTQRRRVSVPKHAERQ